MHPNESNGYAIAFLRAAVAYYATLSITIRRVLTDNVSVRPAPSCRRLDSQRRWYP